MLGVGQADIGGGKPAFLSCTPAESSFTQEICHRPSLAALRPLCTAYAQWTAESGPLARVGHNYALICWDTVTVILAMILDVYIASFILKESQSAL